MTLVAGARLGPYEIVAPLGAGGMGEVYRAKDPRLGREVAIKVLPAEVASDPERLRRFEQEAKAVSALNHPHIVTLHEVGQSEHGPYLVLEKIDGQSLRELLRAGPLPLKRLLTLGTQIAEGLAKAHSAGIVHRDLKPENVMVTSDGFAKILDFGLAKLVYPELETRAIGEATTLAERTGTGMILGTIGYLSPEQAVGKPADFRADQFALGALLYELSTGERPFRRETTPESLAAAIREEPEPLHAKNAALPAQFGWIVQRCLAKDPNDRYGSTKDLARDLADLGDHLSEIGSGDAHGAAAALAPRPFRERFAWGVAAVALFAVAVLAWRTNRRPTSIATVVRSSILAPDASDFDFSEGSPALSPDGEQLVFLARDRDGTRRIWVRSLAALGAQAVAGTEGAAHPFWSPDGTALGYFQNKQLRRLDIRSGESRVLCSVEESARGAAWGPNDTILFSRKFDDGIYRIPASGGVPRRITELDSKRGELTHRFPIWLPDGRHFVYWAGLTHEAYGKEGAISLFAESIEGGDRRPLAFADSSAVYSRSGNLLFLRGDALLAQPFDAERLTIVGAARQVAEHVQMSVRNEAAVSVAPNGTLLYQSGLGSLVQLAWMSRDGGLLDAVGLPIDAGAVELSHDGKRAALVVFDERHKSRDIWVRELDRDAILRFSFEPGHEYSPIWSPDDRQIFYSMQLDDHGEIVSKSSDGSGSASVVFASPVGEWPVAQSLSPDGATLGLALGHEVSDGDLDFDVALLRLSDGELRRLGKPPFYELFSQLAPDGRSVAFASDESGPNQIYLQTLTGESSRIQVSTSGGTHPRWRRDGAELFYLTPDWKIAVVTIRHDPALAVGAPTILFEPKIRSVIDYQYDVSADGRRFLALRTVHGLGEPPLTLVTGWSSELPPP